MNMTNIKGKRKKLQVNKKIKFDVSEWDWFKLQLELYALKYCAEMYSVSFYFESDRQGRILCRIFGKHAETMLANNATRTEQLEYYKDWVGKERQAISEILKSIPLLNKTFDLEKNVVYQIMYSYGMGATLICEFKGGKVIWPPK